MPETVWAQLALWAMQLPLTVVPSSAQPGKYNLSFVSIFDYKKIHTQTTSCA
jgi:hypothetical protein